MSRAPVITVIGSYPATLPTMRLMQAYWEKQKLPPWESYISEAVNDMVRAGVHLLSDGQTRDPFVNIFVRGLRGCRIRTRPEVIDTITYRHPITLADIQYVRSIIPKHNTLLGLLVGPHTFSETVLDSCYRDKKKLAFDAAEALNQEARAIEPLVDMISIDEPNFATSFPSYATELLTTLTHKLTRPLRLHVCGNVTSIVPHLLDMPVDVLSHEFKATPKIFDAYEEYPDDSKRYCIGCVRSDSDAIESVSEISRHIEKARSVFETKIEQLSPDCGLRLLNRSVAFEKLKNLTSAWEHMYHD